MQYPVQLYPAIEPFASAQLKVGSGHSIYYEQCGNPDGIPGALPSRRPRRWVAQDCRRLFLFGTVVSRSERERADPPSPRAIPLSPMSRICRIAYGVRRADRRLSPQPRAPTRAPLKPCPHLAHARNRCSHPCPLSYSRRSPQASPPGTPRSPPPHPRAPAAATSLRQVAAPRGPAGSSTLRCIGSSASIRCAAARSMTIYGYMLTPHDTSCDMSPTLPAIATRCLTCSVFCFRCALSLCYETTSVGTSVAAASLAVLQSRRHRRVASPPPPPPPPRLRTTVLLIQTTTVDGG